MKCPICDKKINIQYPNPQERILQCRTFNVKGDIGSLGIHFRCQQNREGQPRGQGIIQEMFFVLKDKDVTMRYHYPHPHQPGYWCVDVFNPTNISNPNTTSFEIVTYGIEQHSIQQAIDVTKKCLKLKAFL